MRYALPPSARHTTTVMILSVLLGTLAAAPADVRAQAAAGEAVDLSFSVINGTTGEPGRVDRLTIIYMHVRPEPVLDVKPVGAEFVLQDVPLRNLGQYVVTAWYGGVPYYFTRVAEKLADEPQVLHVFDTVNDLADVRITGLNLVVRREQELLAMEYLLQVENAARPQTTVFDEGGTLMLHLPDGAVGVAAEFHRGPMPESVTVRRSGSGRWNLAVGLVSGNNRLRLTATVPWREGLEIPVGSNVPVEAWSLLATPDWLAVDAREMEPDPDAASGVKRLKGPTLEADEVVRLRLGAGQAAGGPTEDVFTQAAPAPEAAETAADADEGSPGLPLPLLGAGLVLVLIISVVYARRRG